MVDLRLLALTHLMAAGAGFALAPRELLETEVVHNGFFGEGEAGLSEAAWSLLDARPGEIATFSHPRTVESFGAVRAKIFGHAFEESQLLAILQDIRAGRYADIDLSAFLTGINAFEPNAIS